MFEAATMLFLAGPGWVSVEFTRTHLDYLEGELCRQAFHQLKNLLDQQGRVLVPQYRRWFQSVVEEALKGHNAPPSDDGSDLFKLKVSVAGPAMTLHVELTCGDKFDVDLVPVFEWAYTQLPEGLDLPEWAHKYFCEMDKWKVVPKANVDDDCAWRIHFPAIEDRLMEDAGGCVKDIIRLVKALVQKNEWKLSSFACKTVVMRHLVDTSTREKEQTPRWSDWDNEHQFTRLLEVLDRMRKELQAEGPGISYLLDDRTSLIAGVDESTRRDIAGSLQDTIDRLEKAPETAKEIFLTLAPVDGSSPLTWKTRELTDCSPSRCDSTSDDIGQLVNGNPEGFFVDAVEAPPRQRHAISDTTSSLDGKPKATDEKAASAQRGSSNVDVATPCSDSAAPVTLWHASQCGKENEDPSCDQPATCEMTFKGQDASNRAPFVSVAN
ncbi:cyclic GMP-AMP synthase-like receptor [Haemaphysalis longicornis]